MEVSLSQKFSTLKEGMSSLRAYRGILREQMASCERDAERYEYRADLLQKCSDIFKAWLEDLLEKNVGSIGKLVTNGLHHIIHDQDLVFKLHQEMRFNRLSMKFLIEEDGVEGDPMASFGGGAVLISSLILRLAIMSRMNMGNLLLLDESMHALANKYVPDAAAFMRQLSERTGVNILMVTHNEEFLDHAHVSYEGWKDESSFHLRRRK